MTKEIKLSIIIVNYNVKKLLKGCIKSIYETIKNIEYEVIVIDNNSSDGSVEMLKNEFPQVKIIENTENKGFAAANNQGINVSRGKYILLLNPDTIVLPNAINTMLEFMDNRAEAGAVGCKILNPDGTLQSSCRNFPSILIILYDSIGLHRVFSKSKIVSRYYLRYWDHDEIRVVDSVKGACLMIRQEVIKKVGLLDERFFLFGEEVDWCRRIKENGWKVFFTPNAQIIHYGGQSSKQQSRKNLIESHKARQQYFQKYYGSTGVYLSKMIFGFGVLLRIMACFPILLLGNEKKRQAKERLKLFSATLKWYLHG